jgi:hypothetical protein
LPSLEKPDKFADKNLPEPPVPTLFIENIPEDFRPYFRKILAYFSGVAAAIANNNVSSVNDTL